MAFDTGTATNYSTLLDALVTFATANGWTIQRDDRGSLGEIILKGSGDGGTDAIYVGIKRYASPGNDTYGWSLQGFTGFTGAAFMLQPGAITGNLPCISLWNDTIKYWFFVNNRRIIVVAQVATIYVAAYLGYILPYGTPGQWPYPLCIGGSNVTDSTYNVPRYSDTSNSMSVCFNPVAGSAGSSPLVIRASSGTWQRLWNASTTILPPGQSTSLLKVGNGVWPYNERYQSSGVGWFYVRPNQAGDTPLMPLRLCRPDTPDLLGIFDGVKYVSGYNNGSEDTATEGSDTYIIFQNTFRTTLSDFFAVLQA
jgi:hypothetical protein